MFLFTDGSDLVGVQRPHDIKYMKWLRTGLLAVGGWPGELFGEISKWRILHQCLNISSSFICLALGVLFIWGNFGKLSFFEIGQTYITAIMTVLCLSRYISLCTRQYNVTVKDFVEDLHLFNHKTTSEYAKETHLLIHKLSHFFIYLFIILTLLAPNFFNLSPLYNNISNGGFNRHPPINITYDHSILYLLPFDYQHNFRGFLVIFIYNWYMSSMCAVIFSSYDLLLTLIIFHLWGHLKILIYDLENFPRPGFLGHASNNNVSHYSPEEMVEVTNRLKDIMKHHYFIIRYNDVISSTFGPNIAIYYAFHQITGCLLLLQLSELDPKALVRFGPMSLAMLELLIQMSVIFELLTSMNDPLMRAAYSVPWECMDAKARVLVLMIFRQTQVPLGLKALGLVEVGCKTMATILKTTVSYFVMLRTFAEKE